jgi:hypothetical protein
MTLSCRHFFLKCNQPPQHLSKNFQLSKYASPAWTENMLTNLAKATTKVRKDLKKAPNHNAPPASTPKA